MMTSLLLFLLLAVAAVLDLRQRRIPNAIPLCILLLAIAVLLFAPGLGLSPSSGASLAGLGVGLAATLPGYALGALGAGDVKLMAAVAVVLGWPLALHFVLVSVLVFGLVALIALRLFGRKRNSRLPMAPAMLCGAGLALLMHA